MIPVDQLDDGIEQHRMAGSAAARFDHKSSDVALGMMSRFGYPDGGLRLSVIFGEWSSM
jgi:hypothetical protein